MSTPANFSLASWFKQGSTPIYDGGSPTTARDNGATKSFELAFSGATVLHQSVGTAFNGNGYITFTGGTTGSGIGNTNITAVSITDDPLFPTQNGLRDTYFGSGTNYTFGNQTCVVRHNEAQKFYMRLRVKWSSNWEWGSDQLKFCKNVGPSSGSVVSTNCPKFSGSGEAHITKLAPSDPTRDDQNVYAEYAPAPTDFNIEDDINNEFGAGSTDDNWAPTLNQWYWLEWEIDAGTPGLANGSYKLWIDGDIYMQLDNVQVAEAGDTLFTKHELGHVWQSGSPTVDISMEWHQIEIWDKRPATLPGVF